MVVGVVNEMERNYAVNCIFNELARSVATPAPSQDAASSDPVGRSFNYLPEHLPAKRMASCPASPQTRAVPRKRSRLVGTSQPPPIATNPQPQAFASFVCGMTSHSVFVSKSTCGQFAERPPLPALSTCPMFQVPLTLERVRSCSPWKLTSPWGGVPPAVKNHCSKRCSIFATPRRGLSFAAVNVSKRQPTAPSTGNFSTQSKLCCGLVPSSGSATTPPYGNAGEETATADVNNKHVVKRKPSRKSSTHLRVNRKRRMDVNSVAAQPTADSLFSKASSLASCNKSVNCGESERPKKRVKQKTTGPPAQIKGYSRGFIPSVTSTPQQNKLPMTSQAPNDPVTSDYFSASPRSSDLDDSFADFLKIIEEGALSAHRDLLMGINRRRERSMKNEKSCCSQKTVREKAKSFRNDARVSIGKRDEFFNVRSNAAKLRRRESAPGDPRIGRPVATSSPLSPEAQHSKVWRPWC